MKSTAATLTLALLGIVVASGCHQTAQRAASMAGNLSAPKTGSDDYETRLGIARTQEQQGKTKKAKKAYEKLVKDNPTNPLVYHRLGVIAAGDEDFDTANGNFRRAYELSPEEPELLADWGYSLFLQGQYAEAEELTRQSAELAPYDTRIANNLRTIYNNSPLSPPVEAEKLRLMPDDQQGIVVAEALDASIPGSEAEWQRASYDKNLSPFEDVTLPEPTSAIADAQAPGFLPSPESVELATKPTAESSPELNEPVVPATLSSITESIQAAANEEQAITPEHVRKLLTRARLELAAGDVEMSHAFAEAAAETSIPLQVFQEKPEEVLDEIEFVTGHNSVMSLENPALATAEFSQVVPPAPAATEKATTSNVSRKLTLDEIAALDPQGFRAIGRKSLSITPKLIDSDGERRLLPERRAYRRLSQAPVVQHSVGYSRDWIPMSYSWEAPQLKYNPLYFEDPQLERYGNEVCILQPFLSGARFYATIPTLPYQMMSEGNSVCHEVYDFGYERPGNGCVPYSLEVPEFSWTGALASGGWAYALVVILP